MMHRCSSSHGNMMGPCTCGLFHSPTNSFSMLFSMPNHKPFDEAEMYHPFTSSSSSSSVDCTLSLGTPSTRRTNEPEKRGLHNERRPSCMSSFRWDMLQSKHAPSPPTTTITHKSSCRGGSNGNNNNNSGGDPLLARRCANCDTTSTPLWRNGPRGPKSLCNACGIRFKKEERRAAVTTTTTTNGGAPPGGIEAQHMINSSWGHQSQPQKMPCFSQAYDNEFRFIEEDNNRDSDTTNGIPYLSWRLNVTDRPSLVHDFTRY